MITSVVYSDRREWEPAVPDIQEVIIVDGVDTIPSRMFSRLSLLTYVSFPDTVTTIGEYAFDDCTRLTSVDLPDGIKVIDRYAISDCWSLANMVLPEALTEIGIRAFRSCAMKEINIPENVNKIASEAFYKCTSLEKIIFAGAAPQIDENAFRRVTATVYYPAGNDTWTEDVMQDYGGALTWIPYFPDVPEGEYYCEPVLWAVEQGITTGTGDGTTFSPDRACTRAQVVTFLWRAAGSPEPQSMNHSFTDVKAGSYYEKAVIWAVENGITSGKGSSTTFQPDTTCNRAEVVTFLWRSKGKPTPESSSNPFPDVPAGSYYEQAVLWAVENGITTGKGNGNFAPTESCTRAHVVTFLYRAFAEE